MPTPTTILVIDDDAAIGALISDVLRDEGYTVYVERDALSGSDALSTIRPDLILCDFHMPQRDGLTFARTVRCDGIDAPIVLLTADSHPPVELGDISFCLHKPFRLTDLLDCVNTYICASPHS